MFARFLPFALLLTAFSPQSAVLTSGEYWAFLSESTSFSINKGTVVPEDWGEEDYWQVDCREFETPAEKNALKLPDALKICNTWEDLDGDGRTEPDALWMGQGAWHVVHEELEPWRGEAIITAEGDLQIGFHHRLPGGSDFRFALLVDPNFAPHRCNAQTGESEPVDGDWVDNWTEDLRTLADGPIPPHFAVLEDQVDTGRLWYLNARSYQFNPDDLEGGDLWFLPEQYEAGYAAGQFSEEDFHSRAPRWGSLFMYDQLDLVDAYEGSIYVPQRSDLFFCQLEDMGGKLGECLYDGQGVGVDGECAYDGVLSSEVCTELSDCTNGAQGETATCDGYVAPIDCSSVDSCSPSIPGVITCDGYEAPVPDYDRFDACVVDEAVEVNDIADEIKSDYDDVRVTYRPMVHDNLWREADGTQAGFDGWIGLHYNYVAITGDIEVGSSVTGAFSLMMDGDESNSRFMVQGKFTVDKIKADRWVTDDLRAQKLEENGNSLCVFN